MKSIYKLLPLLAILLVGNVALAQSDPAKQDKDELPSAESVLMRHVKETGGAENYKNVKTIVAEASISIPQAGMEGTMEMKMKLPGKAAVVAKLPGIGDTIQGSNGKHSWMINPMMGTRLLSGKEAKQITQQGDMKRYFAPKEVFKSMKNAGKEEANGEEAYKIELVRKNGDKLTEFYSVKSGLMVQSVIKVDMAGMGEMEIVTKSGDYRKQGKFKSPSKIVQLLPNGMEQVIQFASYKYNVELDDELFTPPADVQKLIDKEEKKDD